ncbi:MAG TPA: zinc ribbon domain-containing protein [Anaerolineae bacterium]|nr:zinc ribbon domain-containing protein [Anaerolineae bacterium]
MPLYEYRCKDCGSLSEILVFSSDDPLACKTCGSTSLEKLISTFAITMDSSLSCPSVQSCPMGSCCDKENCRLQ